MNDVFDAPNFMSTFGGFAILAMLWALFVTILWMVIGWRAMRAHERLAQAAEDMVRLNCVPPPLR